MCFCVCGMVHIKEPIMLVRENSTCSGGSGFPLSLSEWSFVICLTPYGRKEGNVLFNDALNILFTVIWCRAYGKGPLR